MKERPILFSGPMVREVLADRKTQTRRIVTPQPTQHASSGLHWKGRAYGIDTGGKPYTRELVKRCPYGMPGDRLWVRETWSKDALSVYPCPPIWYRADFIGHDDPAKGEHGPGCKYERTGQRRAECYACALDGGRFRWKPAIHMLRRDSRLTLEVVSVRVERLQSIAEDDARAEGVRATDAAAVFENGAGRRRDMERTARGAFACLWDEINGDRAPWSTDPWVWVVEFRAVRP